MTPHTRYKALLGLVLCLAVALRFQAVHFGLPTINDPDELMFEMGAIRMLSGPTLNPGWFGHPGTTTIYLLAVINVGAFVVAWAFGWAATPKAFAALVYSDPSIVMLPGRVAMVLAGVACVLLTCRLGRELFGRRAGLAAGALLAVSPVHVAWSQVIRTDVMGSCFMLLFMLAALRIARDAAGWRPLARAALWLALAIATKWPFGLAAVVLPAVSAFHIHRDKASVRTEVFRTALFALLLVAFLLAVSPYIALDFATVQRNLAGEAQAHHLGATGGGPLANAAWYLSGPMLMGLGIVGAALAIVGLVRIARNTEAACLLLPPLIVFFGVITMQTLIWERWILPMLPLLAIAAGAGWALLADTAKRVVPARAAAMGCGVACAALLLQPAFVSVIRSRERLNDTRQQATAWAMRHIPPGHSILIEHFAFEMETGPWPMLFPMGDAGCIDGKAALAGKIPYRQIDKARGNRSNVDFGTLPPAMQAACRPDYAILTQGDRYVAERSRFPVEAAAYDRLIARGRIIATFRPTPGTSSGPIVRIVAFAAS